MATNRRRTNGRQDDSGSRVTWLLARVIDACEVTCLRDTVVPRFPIRVRKALAFWIGVQVMAGTGA